MSICDIGALNLMWELPPTSRHPLAVFSLLWDGEGSIADPASLLSHNASWLPPTPAFFILALCRSWLWMLKTRGSDWRACQRTQTTQCSCRQLRMPQGAASPLLSSPQVKDLASLWCLLLPTWRLPPQHLCWALAWKEPIKNTQLPLLSFPFPKALPENPHQWGDHGNISPNQWSMWTN